MGRSGRMFRGNRKDNDHGDYRTYPEANGPEIPKAFPAAAPVAGKSCLKCMRNLPPDWKHKLCHSCFTKWKEKMQSQGKWIEGFNKQT